MMRAVLLVLLGACTGSRTEAAPAAHTAPSIDLAPVTSDVLCVTKGEVAAGAVAVPTMRGFARGAGGDAAQLSFTYRGESQDSRALANGDVRRQLGLKLRAQDGCNVVYVMWRLDPRPKIDVSVKVNPRMSTHEQCGAEGYTKVRSRAKHYVPAYEYGSAHTLRAEILGDEIYVWTDGKIAFQGRLPDGARSLAGPAGLRSDNVAFDLVELAAPAGGGGAVPTCKREGASD
jgi:hypothetical protein